MNQNQNINKDESGTGWFGGAATLLGIFVVLTWLCF